jgi:hypothetical protein
MLATFAKPPLQEVAETVKLGVRPWISKAAVAAAMCFRRGDAC